MEKKAVKEQLSAMLDGELEVDMMDSVLHELIHSDLCETAGIYLQIRDVLRERDAFLELSCNLVDIIREQLQSETYLSVDLNESDHIGKKKHLTIDV